MKKSRAKPKVKSMFVEKLEGRQYGWNSTEKKEVEDEVREGKVEARTYRALRSIWPVGK